MNQPYSTVKTASSWDSFKDTLYECLDLFKPKDILEYGPGVSTGIMSLYPSVKTVKSIEHDEAWYHKALSNLYRNNVTYFLEKDLSKYPYVTKDEKFDLIFIDGTEREKCLDESHSKLNSFGIVVLHDAERLNYKKHINSFCYKFFRDNGNTVVLTNSNYCGNKLGDKYD